MITQPQFFAARRLLLMVLLAVLCPSFIQAQQNDCIESGPHYGAWNCQNNPSFSGNSISPSTICVERVPGTPVTLPDPTDVFWTFTEPLKYRYLTYDCIATTTEEQSVISSSSFWYYDPPPPTDPSPGTYTSDIKIDYWSDDADCPMALTTYTIVEEELARAGWTEEELRQRPKGDPIKVAAAARLRRETTMTLKWISQRLEMGAWTHLNRRLYEQRRSEGETPS
jgi:hypothetical protein